MFLLPPFLGSNSSAHTTFTMNDSKNTWKIPPKPPINSKTHWPASPCNFPDAECNRAYPWHHWGKKTYKIFLFETLHSFIKCLFCLSLSEVEEKRGAKEAHHSPAIKINLMFIQHFEQTQTLRQYLKPSTPLPQCCYQRVAADLH